MDKQTLYTRIDNLNILITYQYNLFSEISDKIILNEGDSKYYETIKEELFNEILIAQDELFELEQLL